MYNVQHQKFVVFIWECVSLFQLWIWATIYYPSKLIKTVIPFDELSVNISILKSVSNKYVQLKNFLCLSLRNEWINYQLIRMTCEKFMKTRRRWVISWQWDGICDDDITSPQTSSLLCFFIIPNRVLKFHSLFKWQDEWKRNHFNVSLLCHPHPLW